VSLDFHKHEMLFRLKNTICPGRSRSLKYGKEDDLHEAEKCGRVTTLNDLGHNLIHSFIWKICVISSLFKAGQSVQWSKYHR
jgi:hypothetical protein